MPPQQGKPMQSLMSRYGDRLRKAHDEAKTKEVKVNAGELPGGIEDGVCQVTKCYFAEYENGDLKGEPYFMATAIVVEPKEHEGKRVVFGPEALCDTPNRSRKTLEEHVEAVENWYKKAGVDMTELDAADAFETTAQAIQEARPFMRFRTWQGQKRKKGEAGYNEMYDGPNAPPPKVNHDWGLAVDYSPEQTESGVDDDTESAPSPPPPPKPTPKPPAAKPGKTPPKPKVVDLSESEDVDALVAAANDPENEQNAAATQRLEALAVHAGRTEDEVQQANSWEEVAEWIQVGSAEPSEGEPESVDEEPAEPQVEDLYEYAPTDPKTKKKGRAVLCEVIKVDTKKSTVDLRSTVNKKMVYPGISWNALVTPD